MPPTVQPACEASWQVILNRRYPSAIGITHTETEAACRAICLGYPTCTAIDFFQSDTENCQVHSTIGDLSDDLAEESPGTRHVRLIQRCVCKFFTN